MEFVFHSFGHRPDDGSLKLKPVPNYVLQVYMLVVAVLLIRVKYTVTCRVEIPTHKYKQVKTK